MNKTTVHGQLMELRGEIKRRWGKLSDNDLKEIQGDAQKLLGKLEQHYGSAKERAQQEVEEFLAAHKPRATKDRRPA